MVQSTASQSGYNCMVRPVRSRNSSMTSSQSRNEKSDKPSQRKSTSLPSETVEYLKAWMMSPEHIAHPYPTEQEKCQIMNDTGIELKQLTNWFVNNRKRYWKPRVEAQLKQKAQAAHTIPMTTNFDTERGFISSYLSVVPPDNHFPTPKRARTVAPPQSSSFVTHSYAVSDCSSSYEGDQVYQSNDETSDYDSNKLPHSISFNGDICIENQNVMENSLSFIHETESVTLHILRPSDEDTHPALEDVTILSNVPTECILRSYFDCIIEYDISRNIIGNLKEIQNVRDAAVLKAKKLYLDLYLESTKSLYTPEIVSDASLEPDSSNEESVQDETSQTEEYRPLKRPRSVTDLSAADFPCEPPKTIVEPRSMYLKEDTEKWRHVCSNAQDFFDNQLPTLEEAARMFGYAKNIVV